MHKISNRIFEIFFKKTLDFLLAGFQVEVAKAKRLFTSFRTNTQHGGAICNPNQKKIKKFFKVAKKHKSNTDVLFLCLINCSCYVM